MTVDDWTTGLKDDGELGWTQPNEAQRGLVQAGYAHRGGIPGEVERIPAGYSPMTDLAQQHMDASELLIDAIAEETGAQVDYDDVYHDELVKSHRDGIQMAIIKDITLSRCKAELASLTRAEGKVKRLKVKVGALDKMLMAEMATAKYAGLADGGTR